MTESIARAGRDALSWARTAIEKADDLLTEWIATGKVNHLDDEWQDLREAVTGSAPRFEELEAALTDVTVSGPTPANAIGYLVWKDMSRGKETSEFAYSGELMIGSVSNSAGRRGEWSFHVDAIHTRYITRGGGKTDSLDAAKTALTASWHEWLRHAGLMPAIPTTTEQES